MSAPSSLATKPRLSLAQIINMSVGFFGIQFAFGLQNANVSRIFQTLGASVESIPVLWIAAPITGLLIQPLIGHFSDKTWLGKWGRRRPYFMLGSIFAALALFIFPNVGGLWMAAIMLWMLDAAINVSMEPFRAFVGDMLPDSQRTTGFAMQSFFIGLGAVISSLLPYILTKLGVANEAAEGVIPDSIKISFVTGAVVFLTAIAYTVFTTKEYSPQQLKSFGEIDAINEVNIKTPAKKFYNKGIWWLVAGLVLSAILYYNNLNNEQPLEKELYILSLGIAAFGLFQILAGLLHRGNKSSGFVEIMDDLNFLPDTMKKLAVVQFFSWFALFAMWIYTTSALSQHLSGTTDPTSKAYNDMGNWVGVLFGAYNLFAAVLAFLLPVLAKKFSRPVTHMIALIAGGLGLISFYFIKNEDWLLLSMVGVGFAWSSILAMPYAMLTKSLPPQKMGVYMGIFNFFIVIPQILAATILGVLTKHMFGGNTIDTIVLGGVSLIVAALFTLRIKDK
ncbi:MFS transporter [Terrimonas rubra]|uniref:MFS transporter n=1 Tax=Terrimonas rubra TaxID=1035890 RepID=A0ABW6AC80_9BACT